MKDYKFDANFSLQNNHCNIRYKVKVFSQSIQFMILVCSFSTLACTSSSNIH